jgi:hypothetical protein
MDFSIPLMLYVNTRKIKNAKIKIEGINRIELRGKIIPRINITTKIFVLNADLNEVVKSASA